jgi:hypothetical protein
MCGDQFRGLAPLVLLLALPACVSTPTLEPPRAAAVTTLPIVEDVGAILQDGEETTYKVAKGFLTVGEITYRVAHVMDGEVPLLRLESHTQASAWLAAFVNIGGVTRSYVDRSTLLPSSYYWVTSDAEDPLIRTASFDHQNGRVYASSYQQKCLQTRTLTGQEMHDPISAMMIPRALDFTRAPDNEVRLYVVEGVDLHLMTLRGEGSEMLDAGGPCPQAARKVSLRTDRLDCHGNLAGEEPYNAVMMGIAQDPPHPILRIEGTVGGTALKLTLGKRTTSRS